MSPLRILFTNNTLAGRGGSELFVRDLATALLARGHHPIAYSTVLGDVADDMRRRTVPVVSDFGQIGEAPDLIHGHHHIETMMALLHFPGVPAVSVCHGWSPWEEAPPTFPRILRYVAVDATCRDRLVAEHGIDPAIVVERLNFVDVERFPARPPLPVVPARAAVFDNEISDDNVLPAIRAACAARGLQLDVVGRAAGNAIAVPEAVLGTYDVIFAKARCAIEALAVGAAVVLCTNYGMGSLVTEANVRGLRRMNFGVRALGRAVSVENLVAELSRYDAADAASVSTWMRHEASLARATDDWVALYGLVLDEWSRRPAPDAGAEGRAASAYLRSVSDVFKGGLDVRRRYEALGETHHRTVQQLLAQQARAVIPPGEDS